MIDASMLTHLLLAFAVGSLWVIAITVIAEKKGSVVGGILGGLPSTSAFSFFFIGINQSSAADFQATTVFPLAFAITSAYLFLYAFFSQKGLIRGISISLLIWFIISGLIVASGFNDFVLALIVGTVISALTYFAFVKKLKLENLKTEKKLYTIREIALRGIGAGALVALSVFLSQVGGPVLGGIAAAFPAVFTSTLIILNRSKGLEFSRAITKPLVYSGILTIIPFCVAVRFLYPSIGVYAGTLVSYVLVVPLAVLSYYAAKHKKS
jgi:uncharacterized membrane protein (GlpM family)